MAGDPQEFAQALGALEEELDWPKLGELHCSQGGKDFFSPEQVEATREAGLMIAGELGDRLAQLGNGPGRSLYVGAAVAELVPILVEQLVLGRELRLINIESEETAELNRAFAAAEACGLSLPRIETCELSTLEGRFDHGWMVSVLNDPEAFPALHDELYGRRGELATGKGNLQQDLQRAQDLTGEFLQRLTSPALVSTTDEELPVFRPCLARLGLSMKPLGDALLTPVVGDPLRFMRLSNAGPGG
ncbi:MAG: hypothetical protein ACI9F9_002402 [Candidatus Paceibacteria bacterium]|jgi:hypothetical protein